jgi:ABC-type multidrug transport system fused ATPase/permease subunit
MKTISLINILWININKVRRKQLVKLVILMFLTSFLEVVGLGAVIPFLAVIMNPQKIFNEYSSSQISQLITIQDPNSLILTISLLFLILITVASIMRVGLLWYTTRVSFLIGADLSLELFSRVLMQPYRYHLSKNSSELISTISIKINAVIYSIVFPILVMISSLLTLIFVVGFLIILSPETTAIAFFFAASFYYLLSITTKRRLLQDGSRIARESSNSIKLLQEALGGIRDVIIDASQKKYCDAFKISDKSLREAQGRHQFISQAPKFIIEAVGMMAIVLLAYGFTISEGDFLNAIPILGLITLGAQRMLPVLQQIYTSRANILNGKDSLIDVIELLALKDNNPREIQINKKQDFKNNISLELVNFRYDSKNENVISNITFVIDKGDRIGLVGETGVGKSTLIDLLMGMLTPSSGTITVDGCVLNNENIANWRKIIAHVPQSIYLFDGTIEENIVLNYGENIDLKKMKESATRASLDDFISSLEQGYQEIVGERGIKLSGGQRQRIGIARALYRDVELLVFDEATSALDEKTESEVMRSIESLDKDLTLIIATHRTQTLKSCNKILELKKNSFKIYTKNEIDDFFQYSSTYK